MPNLRKIAVFILSPLHALLQIVVPPVQNMVSYTSIPDYSDNAFYQYLHLLRTRKSLVHVWIVRDKRVHQRIEAQFAVLLSGVARDLPIAADHRLIIANKFSFRGYWLYLRSVVVYHTHGSYAWCRTAIRREIVCLWHGMPIKCIGRQNTREPNAVITYGSRHIATSDFYRPVIADSFGCVESQVAVSSLPRCDALHYADVPIHSREQVRNHLSVGPGEYLLLWLPTYRKQTESADSLLNDARTFLDDLDPSQVEYLQQQALMHRCKIVVKLHPLDAANFIPDPQIADGLPVIKSDDWQRSGMQLYDLLAASDALISDVSSVVIDFMTLGRPIGIFGFDASQYPRDLVLPIEEFRRSACVIFLDTQTAIQDLFRRLQQDRHTGSRNDSLRNRLYPQFTTRGAEAMAQLAGL